MFHGCEDCVPKGIISSQQGVIFRAPISKFLHHKKDVLRLSTGLKFLYDASLKDDQFGLFYFLHLLCFHIQTHLILHALEISL